MGGNMEYLLIQFISLTLPHIIIALILLAFSGLAAYLAMNRNYSFDHVLARLFDRPYRMDALLVYVIYLFLLAIIIASIYN